MGEIIRNGISHSLPTSIPGPVTDEMVRAWEKRKAADIAAATERKKQRDRKIALAQKKEAEAALAKANATLSKVK